MRKIWMIYIAIILAVCLAMGCSAAPWKEESENDPVITLQIGNEMMTVNGTAQEIDPGRGTVPILENDRTLLPVRAVVEAMGGAVAWQEETQTAILVKGENAVILTIGRNTAYVNEDEYTLDSVPVTRNERTMLPIRFVAEGFGYTVNWDEATQTVTLLPQSAKEQANVNQEQMQTSSGKKDAIVVYFSQTGTTRQLALKIAEMAQADIYEIIPETPYSAEDIDYSDPDCRANREQNDNNARPQIAGEKIDLSGYNTVYIGYPIWWGTIPRIIQTFMDTYDLSGKAVMPFCTSHSSGISSSVSAIQTYCPKADVKAGYRSNGAVNPEEIQGWILAKADK